MAEEQKKEAKEVKPAAAAPKEGEAKEKKKNGRMPSALKRDIQSLKRNELNRSFKSTVRTVTLSLRSALEKKEAKDALQKKLNELYSLLDKGVKKGIFKQNKANRTKARLFATINPKS